YRNTSPAKSKWQNCARPVNFWFCRKVQTKMSKIVTLCDLCSQGIELLRRRVGRMLRRRQLSLANRMHHFHARDRTPRRPERFDPQHRSHHSLHRSMILLDNIIEILRLPHDNGGLVSLIVVRDRCRVAPTLIDGDFLRQSLTANGLA